MRLTIPTLLVLGASGLAAAQSTQNLVLSNDAGNPFTADARNTRRVEWVDYDFDGDLDLFALNYEDVNAVHENQGGGVFVPDTTPGNALLLATRAKGIAFGDLDGDGDADAFLAVGNNDRNRVLENLSAAPDNDPGQFQIVLGSGIASDFFGSYDAEIGDLDGDGNADVVVVNRYQPNNHYVGAGDGSFARNLTSPITSGAAPSREVVFADVDDDGDLDVLVVNSTDFDNELFVNQGGDQGGTEGDFALLAADDFTTDGGTTFGLDVADLDNDGRLDIVVANRNQPNAIYRNTSSAGRVSTSRVSGTVLDGGSADSYDVALGDLESDGDVDIVVANRLANNAVVLATSSDPLASPRQGFVLATDGQAVSDRGNSRSVALADVADYLDPLGAPVAGTLEIALGNAGLGTNQLYRGLGKQYEDLGSALAGGSGEPVLTAVGPTAPGDAFSLEIDNGPPTAATGIAVSIATTPTPFKGGTLVTDLTPGLGFLLDGFTTGALGTLSIPLVVPAVAGVDPGLRVYLQAIMVDGGGPEGFALSNGLLMRVLQD